MLLNLLVYGSMHRNQQFRVLGSVEGDAAPY